MLAHIPGNPLSSGIHWTASHSKHEQQGPILQRSGELQRRGPSQRSCFLGVETWAELIWERWELGGEFTKTLLLKNVHSKLQKLRFRPPVSKFFTTLFPQTIILSPGTSFSLPVTFRPLERCEYLDSIEFQSKEGTFQVSLHATIPRHALELPESVLLPPCAVLHSSRATILCRNASKLRTGFLWEVGPPFQLSPESGVLEPGEECHVAVLFRPLEARVYQAEASCVFGDEGESSCSVLLQGLSKYPYLQISSPGQEEGCGVLEFGSVVVGTSLEKHFEILNPSSVSASFALARLRRPALMETVFHCEVREGRVDPGSAVRVPVCFSPRTVDSTSVDYFCLTCPGAVNRDLLKVSGTCIGPSVSLGASVLDFGCVALGEEATRSVQIVNSSTAEAHYQFDTDTAGHSVFALDQPCGTLPGQSRLTLCLHFRPRHPIAHHRRLACLLLHREPLFLDLIGTCHSDQLKPAILSPRHLRLHKQHLLRGLTSYPPDILSVMLAEKKLQLDEDGALLLQEDAAEDLAVSNSLPSERSPMEEYFHEGEPRGLPLAHVTVEPPELLFDHASASQSVSVTNHTKGKLILAWTPARDSAFSVTPATCDVGPLKTTAFRVTYMPRQQNTFHAAQLECFALYKVLRDHRQTEDRTLCPPWCVAVRVSGHSFQPGREHFLPRFSLEHPRVVFPALSQVFYQTVLLRNTGDLPLIFRLDPEECPFVCVLPTSGLVHPGSHQILTLRSTPAEDRPCSLPLTLQLNASPKHTQELSVVSVAEKLRVALEGDSGLFFKPTAVGSCSQRPLRVRNLSRLPLHFQWRVWSPDQQVLSVQPDAGTLQPNESMVQTWSFSPREEMSYNMKPSLTFWPTQSPGCKKSRLSLKAVGKASSGSLQAERPLFDLGEVLVGGCKSFEVPLLNNGSCPVTFSMTVQQSIVDAGFPEDVYKDPLALELDCLRGTVPARSRMLVCSTVRPARRARYCWAISYQSLSSSGCVLADPQALCQVQGEGVFPTLEVTDARSGGSVEGLSKLQLWGLFSLDALNAYLRRDPTLPELTYRVPTKHSLRRCPSVFTTAMLDFNFCAASQGSDPSSVLLLLENTGSIPVEWSFLFPEDQQIELEYWAENGEFTPTELHQMKVLDNRLFSISPRSGKLQPGQQRAVQFTYRHDFAGTNRLPVLLKLSHGREILLSFVGVTVESDRHYIHFMSSKHIFAPVAIGGFDPPKQVYELYNGGALPVSYRIDTAPLEQLTADNFGHPVLQCLSPDGEVQPGRTALLEWVLSPLEAKTYSVDIPIHVVEGDSMLVTFEGCGFDSRALGESAPIQLQGVLLSVPSTQRVPSPGQVVFLSEERVCLGDIPVCSRSTHMLFLTNVSHTDRVLYTWNLAEQDCQQAVEIYPECGTLAARESALCILTLQASGSPCFYQLDLTCEVTQEEALAQYRLELQHWEQEKERQGNEFTLTEKDVRQTSQEKNPQRGVESGQTTGSTIRKYKTLPPIRGSSSGALVGGTCARPSRAERRAQREAAQVWRRPEPPRPALLHLGVTARAHSLLEFQTFFPSHFNTHHIYRSMQPKVPRSVSCDGRPRSTDVPPLSHGPERDIITHALTSILRSLLDDPKFHQSLVNGQPEPVPYFSQLRPAPSFPSPAPRTAAGSPYPGGRPGSSGPTLGLPHRESPCTAGPTEPQPELVHEPDAQETLQHEEQLKLQESIRRLPECSDLMEDILLNTLQNLMMEAFLGELVLTARPRIIALPPCRRNSTRRRSRGQAESERSRESRGPLGPSPGPYMPAAALLSNLEPQH